MVSTIGCFHFRSRRLQKTCTSALSRRFRPSTWSTSAIEQLRVEALRERVGHSANIVSHELESIIRLATRVFRNRVTEDPLVVVGEKGTSLPCKGLRLWFLIEWQSLCSLPKDVKKVGDDTPAHKLQFYGRAGPVNKLAPDLLREKHGEAMTRAIVNECLIAGDPQDREVFTFKDLK